MRGASAIAAGLIVGMEVGSIASCRPPSFACEDDTACAGLDDGRCEPSGYCSVPDEDCDSGHRYAPHSGELSGQCVEASGSETGSTTTADPSTGTTLVLDGTTAPPDPDTGSGSDSSTGSVPTECPGVALIDEPFDALPLDRSWDPYIGTGMVVDVQGGELVLVATEATDSYAGLLTALPLPLVGFAAVELTAIPPAGEPMVAYHVLASNDIAYGFSVDDDTLYTFFDGPNGGDRTINLYDSFEHRWLRLWFDVMQGRIVWETSPDGLEWKQLDMEDQLDEGFDLSTAVMDLGAGVWEGPLSADPLATFGHARLCALPP